MFHSHCNKDCQVFKRATLSERLWISFPFIPSVSSVYLVRKRKSRENYLFTFFVGFVESCKKVQNMLLIDGSVLEGVSFTTFSLLKTRTCWGIKTGMNLMSNFVRSIKSWINAMIDNKYDMPLFGSPSIDTNLMKNSLLVVKYVNVRNSKSLIFWPVYVVASINNLTYFSGWSNSSNGSLLQCFNRNSN